MNLFGWRRRSEGFEWREHVRTTILLRRARRQRRIDEAREAAVARVQEVRDGAIEAGKAGVNVVAESAANTATKAGWGLWRLIRIAAVTAWSGLTAAGRFIRQKISDLDLVRFVPVAGDSSDRPHASETKSDIIDNDREPARKSGKRLNLKRHESITQESVVIPAPRHRQKQQSPRRRIEINPDVVDTSKTIAGYALKAAAVVGIILVGGQALQHSEPATLTGFIPISTATTDTIEGRATALTGDRLKIGNTSIALDGVAAPLPAQRCKRANGRSWRCGVTAKNELQRLVKSASVSCDIHTSATDTMPARGRCTTDDGDVATLMISKGHVFADRQAGWNDRSAEQDARDNKLGIWAGENPHPADWREQAWAEAEKAAPNGCPIRGYRRRGTRLYVMPWSASYGSRAARRTKAWFCTEEEALHAGYKPAS